jgi:hypothetical protein
MERELKNAYYLLEEVSTEWAKGREDENGDIVIPEDAAARISVMIGDA